MKIEEKAWESSGGRCECIKLKCNHPGAPKRCEVMLEYEKRGVEGEGGWEINLIDPNKGYIDGNYEVVCYRCYNNQW